MMKRNREIKRIRKLARQTPTLTDSFQRNIDYVRLSVTDRCDFRCVYCMAEDMTFMPRSQLLTLEEMAWVAEAFVSLGVSKIRVTGGEPLVRQNVLSLFQHLGQLLNLKESNLKESPLKEVTLTTNGSQLHKYAEGLSEAGVRRVNISLDSLRADRFKTLTRTGDLNQVLQGIDTARQHFERVKLNAVILKGRNDDEILPLTEFALAKGLDISFIEEMPLGAISEHNRELSYLSSDAVRDTIESRYPLLPSTEHTAGPSRYFRHAQSPSRIGFISPHSHNFCSSCNRVRVTAEGRLLLCLGNEDSVDLRKIVRESPGDIERLAKTIQQAMHLKPEQHHFDLADEPQILRFMNTTGG